MFTELVLLLHLISVRPNPQVLGISSVELATHSFSLADRYENSFVNGVFKDNILLTLNYMAGTVKGKGDIKWEDIEKPFHYEFTLAPGEGFAFHDHILPQYTKSIVRTTNAHFNWDDGFKSDGYLAGDGVCHLASLVFWAAKDAGLETYAPRNHDFATIPEVPREYGVSIYVSPASNAAGQEQNLYIINNQDHPVTFVFDYKNDELSVTVLSIGGFSLRPSQPKSE